MVSVSSLTWYNTSNMGKITINDFIVADPEVCHGKPTFKGTRVMVWQVLEMLSEGESIKVVLKSFPSLKKEYVMAALDYASSLTKENYIVVNVQA